VYIRLLLVILYSFLAISGSYADGGTEDLVNRVTKNGELFKKNLDQAYLEIQPLLLKAQQSKDSLSELILIERKCRYFYAKNQYDSLNEASLSLLDQSIRYNNNYFQAMGHMFQAEGFSVNSLYDRAIKSLTLAYNLLSKDKSGDAFIFFAKANILNSFANIYNDNGEPEKAVEKVKEAIGSYNSLKNNDDINQFQYLNYSNLAGLYSQFNIDSAEFYAKKSIDLRPSNVVKDKAMMMNYYVLGKASKLRNENSMAASYYHKAIEASVRSGSSLNLTEIFNNLIDIYEKEGDKDSVLLYVNKLKEMQLNILQSKYNALQKTVISGEPKKTSPVWIISLAVIMSLIIFYLWRKLSGKRQVDESASNEVYNSLIQLLKDNDPGFYFACEQVFPDFSEKLLVINPTLAKTEIEFCFLLKLKLTTKEIAQLTFIEPRTVQNKKYRIRKRLEIPSSADIYVWLDNI